MNSTPEREAYCLRAIKRALGLLPDCDMDDILAALNNQFALTDDLQEVLIKELLLDYGSNSEDIICEVKALRESVSRLEDEKEAYKNTIDMLEYDLSECRCRREV